MQAHAPTPVSKGRAPRGFSLVEVMVALCVLAIGLLAIAQLQSALLRASAEARAHTLATALARDKIEQMRAFTTMRTGDSYQALTDGEEQIEEGGARFTRTWTVTRFVFNRDPDGDETTMDGAFEEIEADTGEPPSAYRGGVATGFVEGIEFKLVTVALTWNDISGDTQTVTIKDAIAALAPSDSALVAEGGSAVVPRALEVMLRDPTLTDGVPNGVIPLALSSDPTVDGGSTAATNPQPLLLGADYRVAETRFSVLTYGAIVDGTAAAQARVETVVVGCTCSYGLASQVRGYRPSHWNGYRYSVPQRATYAQPAGWTGAQNESPHCTACCRDHHDSVGGVSVVPVGGARFDPRRSDHVHYRRDAGGQLVAAGSGTYDEACRLVRVDGVYRVTSDAYTDQFNLLATRNDGSAAPFVPTDGAIANYQRFALDYLGARVVDNGYSDRFNDTLSPATVAALEDPGDPAASLNAPAVLPIDNGQQKWMHLRGLYLDHLEPRVVNSILAAKAQCAMDTRDGGCASTPAKKESLVLRLLPFTSINLTEIGDWTPAKPSDPGGQDVLVYNNLLKCTVPAADGGPATGCTTVVNGATVAIDPARPVRGLVSKLNASASAGNRPVVRATGHASNSQLAALSRTIDPDEGERLADAQTMEIAGASGPGVGGAVSYRVAILGYPLSAGARPVIDTNPAAGYVYSSTSVPGFTLPNPVILTPNPVVVGVPVTLILRNYNFASTTYSQAASATCTGPSGNKILTPSSTSTNWLLKAQATCKNFAVSAADVDGAAVAGPFAVGSVRTPGSPEASLTEFTTLSLPAIDNGDTVNLTLVPQADVFPAPVCTYVASDLTGAGNWKGSSAPTVTPGSCPP